MALRDVHDGIHLAGNAGIVDRNNRLCFIGNGVLNKALVHVHRLRMNVNKHAGCTAKYEGIRR